jgi:zinc/manganese transport system substrate-binding protein
METVFICIKDDAMRSPRLTHVSAVFGATLLALTVAACGGDESQPHGLTVVASTDVWGSVARAVAGDYVKVDSILTSSTDDPHSYEATPANAAAIADASLVVYNGGGYDHWVDDVLKAHSAVATVDAYSLLPSPTTPDGPANEHVFYDPAVAKAVAARIADRLAADDPAHGDAYHSNAAEFGRQTDAIAASERAIGARHPGAAVASTEPVAHYMLVNAGITDRTPAGFASAAEEGDDPSPADLAAMLDLIAKHQISALVVNTQTESAVTKQIQEAAGKASLPVVDVTETLPEGLSYLDWQRKTVESLGAQLDRAPAMSR